jgi:hypothetical protein
MKSVRFFVGLTNLTAATVHAAAGSGHDQNVGRYTLRVGFSLAIRSQSPTLEAFCKCPVLKSEGDPKPASAFFHSEKRALDSTQRPFFILSLPVLSSCPFALGPPRPLHSAIFLFTAAFTVRFFPSRPMIIHLKACEPPVKRPDLRVVDTRLFQ